MIATVVLASILAAPQVAPKPGSIGVGVGAGGKANTGGNVEVFYDVTFNRPDIDSAADLAAVTGLTPLWAWFAHTPLVAEGTLGGALTQTAGTAVAQNAPFCPSGDWTSLADTTKCQQARRFDADVYTTSSSSLVLSGDVTVCAVTRSLSSIAGDAFIFSSNAGTGDGIELKATAASSGVGVLTASGATTTATIAVDREDQWQFSCMTVADATDTMTSYINNASASGTGAYAATWAPGSESFTVGARDSAGTSPFVGDILWVALLPDDLTTTQISMLFQRQLGAPAVQGQIATTLTTGAGTCCWVDGMVECFSNIWIPMGCENPASASSSGGLLLMDNLTNRLLRTRTLNTGWTEVPGAGVVGAISTSASPLASGLGVFPVVDDSAVAAEYIEQVASITFLSTPSTIGVWARSVSGTAAIDVQVRETTGASCTESNVDWAAQTITTSWGFYEFSYPARADSDCTSGTFRFGAVGVGGDIADVAQQGSAYIMPVVSSTSTPVAMWVESAGTQATYSGGIVRWNNVLSMTLDNTHTFVFEADFAPLRADIGTAAAAILAYTDDGANTPTDYIGFSMVEGTDDVRADYSANSATWAAYSPVAGTSTALKWVINYGTDSYILYVNGTSVASSATAASAPSGIDSMGVGSAQNTARRPNAGVMISRVRAYRTK